VRRLLGLAGVASLAFVSGLALVHLGMLVFVRSGAETRVPDVVGRDLAEARAILANAGFTGVQERETNSGEFAAGKVAEQRPTGGALLRRGRKVWVTVSLGERSAAVPPLLGLSVRQAAIALQRERLESGTVSRAYHDAVPRGDVVAQDPPAGAALGEGGRVDLLVSLGPEPAAWALPDLTGRPAADVERVLARAGIRIGERTVVIDRSVLPFTVLEHEPKPGSRVLSGQRVDLVVSSRR
jgi:serine/threonine-protein kinase